VTLALAGDVMLGRLMNDIIRECGVAYPWGDLLPVTRSADLCLVNLECALTAHANRWFGAQPKPFHFRAEPSAVETLRTGGVDFVSLANNHIGDFGPEGLLETIAVLDRAGIAHAGAGPTAALACAPARLMAQGCRVGVVAFADHPEEWAATDTAPGLNYAPVSLSPVDLAYVESVLADAREQADLLICSYHWGPNMCRRPTVEFRDFAHRLIGAGVDVFWGHSAHVVQGIEVVDGRLILYDTGDFLDDYATRPELRNDLSALFLLRLGPSGRARLDLVPVHIERGQVRVAWGGDRDWIVRRIAESSAEFGTELLAGPEGLSLELEAPG
jgi:poly-gamma-glutamate synthesis protein (capsule biosynthesis protein)